MKKICKALCSVLFATAMTLPVNALAGPCQELDSTAEEQDAQSAESDNYQLTFLTGDFGLQYSRSGMTDQSGNSGHVSQRPERKNR